jgi:hypothetical protein
LAILPNVILQSVIMPNVIVQYVVFKITFIWVLHYWMSWHHTSSLKLWCASHNRIEATPFHIFTNKVGNLWVGWILKFVKFIGAMPRSFSQPALPAGGINKDLTVLIDGARPHPKYIFKNYMGLTNTKMWPSQTLL